jgi:type VI protein secretion system component VasK
LVAQTLLVLNIIKIKGKISEFINSKILTLKIILVSTLVIVAFLSAPILNSSEYTHFKHALEWNYFLGVVTFYLLTFLFWKRK